MQVVDLLMQSVCLGNIGESYAGQGDYRQAIKYAYRSNAVDLALGDSHGCLTPQKALKDLRHVSFECATLNLAKLKFKRGLVV